MPPPWLSLVHIPLRIVCQICRSHQHACKNDHIICVKRYIRESVRYILLPYSGVLNIFRHYVHHWPKDCSIIMRRPGYVSALHGIDSVFLVFHPAMNAMLKCQSIPMKILHVQMYVLATGASAVTAESLVEISNFDYEMCCSPVI